MATKQATLAPSTPKELKDTLWKAADKLRGSMDASQYKDVVLGLVFLKYVSDAFEERREAIRAELAGEDEQFLAETLEEVDEYTGSGVFWVHPEARWEHIAAHAKGTQAAPGVDRQTVGDLIDSAMGHLGRDNTSLEGTLPRIYGRDNVDQRRLGELLDLLNSARFTGQGATKARDLLGEVYEYFLDKFARAEGKRGGEFYTPPVLVRTLVEILEPHEGRIYDPACGTGGMLLEAVHHIREQGGEWRNMVIRGQERNLTTQAIARMNMFLHGIEDFDIVRGDTLRDPAFSSGDQLEHFDCVLANPPFSLSQWGAERWLADRFDRNVFGVPTDGNGDYAWIMHMMRSLKPKVGRMAVVMPLGVLFRGGREGKIREELLKGDYVEAVIELGPNLFYGTGIPACILVIRMEKAEADRLRVRFINASGIFTKGRAQNTLSNEQADEIFALYQSREDVPGVTRSVGIQDIHDAGYTLKLGQYVQAEQVQDTITVEEALADLKVKLAAQQEAEDELEALLRKAGYL